MKYDKIIIIYNPKSTGSSQRFAEDLRKKLLKKFKPEEVELVATKYGGHAEDLAYEAAKQHKRPLLVSSSGDGGYHEVINGAMRAKNEGASPVCAVLPAGNANDHARTMHRQELSQLIIKGDVKKLDLLKIEATYWGRKRETYAHSYVGLGLTPTVAAELNKRRLNSLTEAWIVIKGLWNLSPVRVAIDGRYYMLDSLICSTIPEMSKVLKISKKAKPDDGIFEVSKFEHTRKPTLIYRLLKGAIKELEIDSQTKELELRLLSSAPLQMDGEVMICKRGSRVRITIDKQALATIV